MLIPACLTAVCLPAGRSGKSGRQVLASLINFYFGIWNFKNLHFKFLIYAVIHLLSRQKTF